MTSTFVTDPGTKSGNGIISLSTSMILGRFDDEEEDEEEDEDEDEDDEDDEDDEAEFRTRFDIVFFFFSN
jgi:hypothetical protein